MAATVVLGNDEQVLEPDAGPALERRERPEPDCDARDLAGAHRLATIMCGTASGPNSVSESWLDVPLDLVAQLLVLGQPRMSCAMAGVSARVRLADHRAGGR